jgi:hypothetical protein
LARVLLIAVTLVGGAAVSGCEQLRAIIDSISDGAECATSAQCLGGVCLDDFPGGYCSTADCFTEGCSNIFGSECLQLPGAVEPLCYENCDLGEGAVACRSGYECFAIETARVCLPASFDGTLRPAGVIGSACENDEACDDGTCLPNFVGGYCSIRDCTSDAQCDGGRCLTLEDETAETSLVACFSGCTGDAQCRFGYQCIDPDGSGGVCLPVDDENRSPVRNPQGLDDGEPCSVGINCKGGTCLRAAEGFPGGYCTTLDCASVGCNEPAAGSAQCRVITEETACYVNCTSDATCREGYVCVGADIGDGYCAPPAPITPPPTEDTVLGVVCDDGGASTRTIAFDIAPGTVSFAVVPFSESSTVRPLRLRLPDGSVGANFDGDHAFLDVNPFFIETAAPVFFPAAPQFSDIAQQGGGRYELDVATSTSRLCWYVLEKAADGQDLAVNIYFVGVAGLDTSTAGTHSGFNTMIDTFEAIYRDAGFQIDTIRLFDVDQATAEQYAVIRDLNDIFSVVSAGADPGTSLTEKLSVDVFLINAFAVPEAPGLLGVSLGLPGVPGMHGASGTGLVFTAEYLNSNAAQTGQTMAHEIGHFNGLRHTSEHGGTEWDPLADTPQCSNPERGSLCPDASNLMFPFSLGTNQETVTANQIGVLRASPHTR